MSKTTQPILTDEQLNIAVQATATKLEMALERLRGKVEILLEASVHIAWAAYQAEIDEEVLERAVAAIIEGKEVTS